MSRKQSDPSEEFPTMQTVRFERDNTVGRIVLANPPFNRLDLRFSECLRQAVHDASESDIRVVLVKAEGPHFSFGGEVREWPGKDINWFRTFVAEGQSVVPRHRGAPCPDDRRGPRGRVRRRFRACSQLRLHRSRR